MCICIPPLPALPCPPLALSAGGHPTKPYWCGGLAQPGLTVYLPSPNSEGGPPTVRLLLDCSTLPSGSKATGLPAGIPFYMDW